MNKSSFVIFACLILAVAFSVEAAPAETAEKAETSQLNIAGILFVSFYSFFIMLKNQIYLS